MNEIFGYWLWILFPLFFALGWAAARIDMKQVVKESSSLPRSYFQGLNFLLNEQSDKAIDSFLEVARIDSQTVELHFALGNLFRRRGETNRAIRMHQNLIERDDLEQNVRLKALLELGQDFLTAGLLDRAEGIFQKLLNTNLDEKARQFLLYIYQSAKEWQKAIDMAQQMPDVATQTEIAQYYCEIAEQMLIKSQLNDELTEILDLAILHNRQCVRATILRGDLYLRQQQIEKAIDAWQKVELQNPIYLSLVAVKLNNAYNQIGQNNVALELLKNYLNKYSSLDILEAVIQSILQQHSNENSNNNDDNNNNNESIENSDENYVNIFKQIHDLIRIELDKNPSLLGLEKLFSVNLHNLNNSNNNRDDIEIAKAIIKNYTRRLSRYRCLHCGFKARQFYWRCPACGKWETMPPRRTEEIDQNF